MPSWASMPRSMDVACRRCAALRRPMPSRPMPTLPRCRCGRDTFLGPQRGSQSTGRADLRPVRHGRGAMNGLTGKEETSAGTIRRSWRACVHIIPGECRRTDACRPSWVWPSSWSRGWPQLWWGSGGCSQDGVEPCHGTHTGPHQHACTMCKPCHDLVTSLGSSTDCRGLT